VEERNKVEKLGNQIPDVSKLFQLKVEGHLKNMMEEKEERKTRLRNQGIEI
jgi:hypothetical protein